MAVPGHSHTHDRLVTADRLFRNLLQWWAWWPSIAGGSFDGRDDFCARVFMQEKNVVSESVVSPIELDLQTVTQIVQTFDTDRFL